MDALKIKQAVLGGYAKRFTGQYQFRLISGGIGHNLSQEASQAFAQAIVDVDPL